MIDGGGMIQRGVNIKEVHSGPVTVSYYEDTNWPNKQKRLVRKNARLQARKAKKENIVA